MSKETETQAGFVLGLVVRRLRDRGAVAARKDFGCGGGV